MAKAAAGTLEQNRSLGHSGEWAKQAAIIVSASLFVALCARVSVPLPFTPVPLTLQNFAVILVGLLLGSRRGFAALALYLAEGAAGLPVFSPSALGLHGTGQILGPTGGYLMAYPVVAALAGWICERGTWSFVRAAVAGLFADVLLFVGGVGWLALYFHSTSTAIKYGLYWFILAEVIKVLMAAGIAERWNRRLSKKRV